MRNKKNAYGHVVGFVEMVAFGCKIPSLDLFVYSHAYVFSFPHLFGSGSLS